MFFKERDNFMFGIQHALSLPLRRKCAELTVLFDRGTLLELHNIFPVLIDNIFGPQGTVCWWLRTTTEEQLEDFQQLHHFLSPCGPLFNLIYTLLKDPSIKYEFPLTFLPEKVKQFLEHPTGHPFYSDLINTSSNKQVTSLMLNAFDYYFFHFAYHLINPWQQRAGAFVTSWNTVYYVLCCDYILHFLPTDPNTTILPEIYYNGKNPTKSIPTNLTHPPRSGGINIFMNPIVLNKNIEDNKFVNLDRHHPRNEIWRSETVLTVFIDMWLHIDSINQSISPTDVMTSRLYFNELPTGEYMRIVRALIKQLHSFANSAKEDDTPLGELKKITISMIQGKVYIFLRNLIHRWPLDGSFRLVLELWLTYIQPWRYFANTFKKQMEVNPDTEDALSPSDKQQHTLTSEYLPFIAENLLCYTVIFHQLLSRFVRVDLVSPKMSLMLYRITKVFDQPNLPDYLKEVEQCVDNNRTSPTRPKHNAEILPPLSPSAWLNTPTKSFWNHNTASTFSGSIIGHGEKKWLVIVRQRMNELEGPSFVYKKLFSEPPVHEVYELLIQIQKSIGSAQNIIKMKEHEEKEMYSGFWGSVKYLLQASASTDEFTLNDRKKVPLYLEVSLGNLKDMFNIRDEMLTPERVRSRLKTIKYEGDPDLLPIRSDECAFLVRTLYQVSLKINENFGTYFNQLYRRPTYCGRFSRQILCPPVTVYKYDKSMPGSPRVDSNLPPRISLRPCASLKFLTYLFCGAFISWMLNYRLETYFVLLFLLFVLYKALKSIPNDGCPLRHSYPTQGFGNISFNESNY
ncbi:sphingomyelin phosphodiesterase 4 isoform X2 [Cylas formicarius]|uniref:sphingomyelin phosphodiesterase 4 isoform X2 n=1 Tax=Cylas formicarius TaxID=197179 RepID=UPI002958C606|nr:sphingomyelin phosphodiesterase 4 isoform X2 [Cylas formicarius]